MNLRTIITIGVTVALFVLLSKLVGNYISIEQMKMKSCMLREYVSQDYVKSVIVYIAVVMLFISFTLPVMIPLTLSSGFLFGAFGGALYTTIGAALGCLISFLLYRYALGAMLKRKYHDRLERFDARMRTYGPTYILILHYSAVVPLFIINSCAALTRISLPSFMIFTVLGLFPVCFVYAFAGRELSSIKTMQDIFSPTVIGALLLLMCLAFVPILVKRKRGSVEV